MIDRLLPTLFYAGCGFILCLLCVAVYVAVAAVDDRRAARDAERAARPHSARTGATADDAVAMAKATPHELELRQRRAWSAAGCCPMCNTADTHGYLCSDCTRVVRRRLPSHQRRAWRRYEPPATGAPIQDHGYTPAGLLGIDNDPKEQR